VIIISGQNIRRRQTVRRARQKNKKLSTRGLVVIVISVVLVCVGIVGYFYLKPQSATNETNESAQTIRKYTTFQTAIKEQYDDAKPSFIGERSELELVAQYFATNIFTLWGVQNEDDYNGKDMIPPANAKDFDQQAKNNLVFQFNQIVQSYGAANLPIVSHVEVGSESADRILYDGQRYTAYNVSVVMSYQDGTLPGTVNDDVALANQLLQAWVHSAELAFFWLPNEDEIGGEWKLSSMTDLISNEHALRADDEY